MYRKFLIFGKPKATIVSLFDQVLSQGLCIHVISFVYGEAVDTQTPRGEDSQGS